MPTYDYRCTKCDHKWEEVLPIAKRDEPLANPCIKCGAEIERYLPSTFGLDYSLGDKKPSNGFTDILKRIKKAHRGSTINV